MQRDLKRSVPDSWYPLIDIDLDASWSEQANCGLGACRPPSNQDLLPKPAYSLGIMLILQADCIFGGAQTSLNLTPKREFRFYKALQGS